MKFQKITLLLIMMSFLSFFGCSNTPKENNITVAEFYELLQNEAIIVLDVRAPEEISQGKIMSNALETNFHDDNFINDVTSKISKDQTVYVYCRSGNRSGKTVARLRDLGYGNTYNIEGGIKAWKAKGYKVE
jgi:rhodanese-related sulfurtransferase